MGARNPLPEKDRGDNASAGETVRIHAALRARFAATPPTMRRSKSHAT